MTSYSLSLLLYSLPILVLVSKMSLLGVPSHPWFCSWTSKKKNWVLSHLCMQHLCKLPLAFPIPVLVSRSYPLSCFLISSCPSLASSPSSFWPMKFCLVTILSYSIVNTSHVMLTWCSSSCVMVIAHAVSAKKKHSRPKVFFVWVCKSVSPRVSEECVRQWRKPVTKCAFQCTYPHSQGLDMLLWALNKALLMDVLSHMLFWRLCT